MRSFTVSRKLSIIAEQERESLSNNEICHRRNIQSNQLRTWKSQKDVLLNSARSLRKIHPGRPLIYRGGEERIEQFILSMRAQKSIVNIRTVIQKLHEFCPESVEKSFVSKLAWAYRFIKSKKFSIRRITKNVTLDDDELNRRAAV